MEPGPGLLRVRATAPELAAPMEVELAHKTECALAQELAAVMAMELAQETGRDSAETTAPPWA